MAASKRKARTIADIEREAAEIERAEHDAFATLAMCVRELAMALPDGSPYDFAKYAQFIDLMNGGRNPGPAVEVGLVNLVRDHMRRRPA